MLSASTEALVSEVGVALGSLSCFQQRQDVICRAWLCSRSFLDLSGILTVSNLLEHMSSRVKEGMVGYE